MRIHKQKLRLALAAAAAGCVNGLFGAGGGMVLVPLLTLLTDLEEQEIFSSSVCLILPMCLISLGTIALQGPLPWSTALPYLLGSLAAGLLVSRFGKKIPTRWLHKILGGMILWGGIRYLC